MTASVITSTIGRPELRQCIESVRALTYPARHFVYVNGPKYHAKARAILEDYPEVCALYLPEETGDYGTGGSMADVFAAAPFLTRADWIFYLDDDNFYERKHVESLLTFAKSNDLAWAYSLRRVVDKSGAYICDDDWCSIGVYPARFSTDSFIVDNSCFAITRALAQRFATAWTALPVVADRCMLMALRESGTRFGCTGLATVNYRLGTGTAVDDPEAMKRVAGEEAMKYPSGFPWRMPQVFGNSSPSSP